MMQQQKLLNRFWLSQQQSRRRIIRLHHRLYHSSTSTSTSTSNSSVDNYGGWLDKRLNHGMPHRDEGNYTQQRRVLKTPYPNDLTVDPNFIWEDYHERYKALPLGTSFREQRKAEHRWNWRVLLPNFWKTSPVSFQGAAWHALYASLIITPHQIFHQDSKVQQAIAKYWAEDVGHTLPWNDMVQVVEPFVKYHDMVSGDLLAAFSIYSTAMFLILSMRVTSAINYQREGHQSYTDLTVEVLKFAQKTQLYSTSKKVSVELSVWAYAAVRAAELHLQNIHDPIIIKKTLAGVLLQTTTAANKGGEQQYKEELPNSTTSGDDAEANAGKTQSDDPAIKAFLIAPNKPIYAFQHLTLMCRDAFDQAYITNIRALIDVQNSIGKMTDAYQRCVQIQAQPEPYSYNLSMKVFLQVWVGFLPLVLVPTLHLCTVPMSTALAFFVYKLDEISAEMQNPYGHDASDIAITLIGDRLQQDLSQMLVVYDPLIPISNATSSSPSTSFPTKKYSNSDEKQFTPGEVGAGDWADDEKLTKRVGLGTKLEPEKQK